MPARRFKKTKKESKPDPEDGQISKIRRIGPKTLRGRRGSLKDLPKMPLDILFELFGYMHPMDLLNLARTTREFRALLMSRSSSSFWKASRVNVDGLPDCPSFLSEPQYANLVFSAHCHECLRGNIQTAIWEFRARYCSACKQKMCVNCIYRIDGNFTRGVLCIVEFKRCWRRYPDHKIHAPDFHKLRDGWNIVKDHQSWEQFKKPHEDMVTTIENFSKEMQIWADKKQESRSMVIEEIREQRQKAIRSKLRESGWSRELDHIAPDYDPLQWLACYRLSRPFSEKVWENMKAEVLSKMGTIRKRLLDNDRHEILAKRMLVFRELVHELCSGIQDGHPPAPEIALWPEIQGVIDAPDDVQVDLSSFDNFRIKCSEGADSFELNNPLELAIGANFTCRYCHEIITHPHAYAHACTIRYVPSRGDEHEIALYNSAVEKFWEMLPWKDTGLSSQVDIATCIVTVCGQDPKSITAEEMDRLKFRLTCTCGCTKAKDGVRRIFNWKEAILHTSEFWKDKKAKMYDTWKLLSGQDYLYAMTLEYMVVMSQPQRLDSQELWNCRHCAPGSRRYRRNKDSIKEHLAQVHNKETSSHDDMFLVLGHVENYLPDRYIISNRLNYQTVDKPIQSAIDDNRAMFEASFAT
ncbi:hypothetical protein ABKN59_002773 [Abortiporus biennis]